jgi:hypothetical protein
LQADEIATAPDTLSAMSSDSDSMQLITPNLKTVEEIFSENVAAIKAYF